MNDAAHLAQGSLGWHGLWQEQLYMGKYPAAKWVRALGACLLVPPRHSRPPPCHVTLRQRRRESGMPLLVVMHRHVPAPCKGHACCHARGQSAQKACIGSKNDGVWAQSGHRSSRRQASPTQPPPLQRRHARQAPPSVLDAGFWHQGHKARTGFPQISSVLFAGGPHGPPMPHWMVGVRSPQLHVSRPACSNAPGPQPQVVDQVPAQTYQGLSPRLLTRYRILVHCT